MASLPFVGESRSGPAMLTWSADPAELNSLAEHDVERVGALGEVLTTKVAAMDRAETGDTPQFSDELLRRLRSLGYMN